MVGSNTRGRTQKMIYTIQHCYSIRLFENMGQDFFLPVHVIGHLQDMMLLKCAYCACALLFLHWTRYSFACCFLVIEFVSVSPTAIASWWNSLDNLYCVAIMKGHCLRQLRARYLLDNSSSPKVNQPKNNR